MIFQLRISTKMLINKMTGEFIMLINAKMSTIVDILTFIEYDEFHAQLS